MAARSRTAVEIPTAALRVHQAIVDTANSRRLSDTYQTLKGELALLLLRARRDPHRRRDHRGRIRGERPGHESLRGALEQACHSAPSRSWAAASRFSF